MQTPRTSKFDSNEEDESMITVHLLKTPGINTEGGGSNAASSKTLGKSHMKSQHLIQIKSLSWNRMLK